MFVKEDNVTYIRTDQNEYEKIETQRPLQILDRYIYVCTYVL